MKVPSKYGMLIAVPQRLLSTSDGPEALKKRCWSPSTHNATNPRYFPFISNSLPEPREWSTFLAEELTTAEDFLKAAGQSSTSSDASSPHPIHRTMTGLPGVDVFQKSSTVPNQLETPGAQSEAHPTDGLTYTEHTGFPTRPKIQVIK